MATTTPSLTLSLRPVKQHKSENDKLEPLVRLIDQQVKGFRHATEQRLLDTTQNSDAMDIVESSEPSDEQPEAAEKQKGTEQFVRAQSLDMIGQLNTALNETLMLLDFTSLLESHYIPEKGGHTLSPFLKERVPNGSLAFDRWEMPAPKKQKLEEERQITSGWKAESFARAADSLLTAATRLKQDVEKETTYWKQVLTVKDQGWIVFRSPISRQSVGVQIASLEAGPLFKERGLVTFTASKDGKVALKHPSADDPKMVRVRMSRRGKIIGSSKVSLQSAFPETDNSLGSDLQYARDSLFEEELFHEMRVEARNLLSLGVKDSNDVIEFSISPQSSDVIDSDRILIDLTSQSQGVGDQTAGESNEYAQSISLALRLMLSDYHRQRFRTRTAIPPPLSDRPRPPQTSTILRTIVRIKRHEQGIAQLRNRLRTIAFIIQSAGLSCSTHEIQDGSATTSHASQEYASIPPSLRPSKTSLSIDFPSAFLGENARIGNFQIGIDILTGFSAGAVGTSYRIHLPARMLNRPSSLSTTDNSKHKPILSLTLNDLTVQVMEYLTRDILHNVLSVKFPSWAARPDDKWLFPNDGITKRTALVARLLEKDGRILLEAFRSNPQGRRTDTILWDGTPANQSLVDIIAAWIIQSGANPNDKLSTSINGSNS